MKNKVFRSRLIGVLAFYAAVSTLSSETFFDRMGARGYARRWWSEFNSKYTPRPDADCAHFVSQCLIAGGLSLHKGRDGTGLGVYPDNYNRSLVRNGTITRCGYLHEHLRDYQPTTVQYVTENDPVVPEWISPGDVAIFGRKGGTEFYHAMIVINKTENDCELAGHNNEVWGRSFKASLNNFGSARFYHFNDADVTDKADYFKFMVTNDMVNVRVGPGLDSRDELYQDIGNIYRDQVYVGYERFTDAQGRLWYHFFYDDRSAWCVAKSGSTVYAEEVDPAGSSITAFSTDVEYFMNVRSGPGSSNNDIGELYPGRLFAAFEEENGWNHFYYAGSDAWSYAEYTVSEPFDDPLSYASPETNTGSQGNKFTFSVPGKYQSFTEAVKSVKIYGFSGRLIKEIQPVQNRGSWDGTDMAGGKVGSGAFIAQLVSGNKITNYRFVISK